MVQLIHLILHEALKHAVRWQLLSRNPADAVEPPRPRKATVHVLSLDEADTLLEGLKDRRDYPVVYLPLRTGMRRGELLALKWSDVDLAKRRLRG
jgi:integrase